MNKPSYDAKQIAQELKDTAQGLSYYGNALLVCLDFPLVADNPEYKAVVTRYLQGRGAIKSTDHVTLYEIAIKLQESSTSQEPAMTTSQTQLVEAIDKELTRRYDRIIALIDERYKLTIETITLQSRIAQLENQVESLQALLHEHKTRTSQTI